MTRRILASRHFVAALLAKGTATGRQALVRVLIAVGIMLAPQLAPLIAPGGVACVEIGATQEASAGALFAAKGLGVALRHDLAGRPRCLMLRSPN